MINTGDTLKQRKILQKQNTKQHTCVLSKTKHYNTRKTTIFTNIRNNTQGLNLRPSLCRRPLNAQSHSLSFPFPLRQHDFLLP